MLITYLTYQYLRQHHLQIKSLALARCRTSCEMREKKKEKKKENCHAFLQAFASFPPKNNFARDVVKFRLFGLCTPVRGSSIVVHPLGRCPSSSRKNAICIRTLCLYASQCRLVSPNFGLYTLSLSLSSRCGINFFFFFSLVYFITS